MFNRRPAGRPALTLMELIVVLAILVALASMLIPVLPGMLNRAHTSTGATNVGELNKSVQTYEQLYLTYPDALDALTDAAGGAPADYLSGLPANQLTMRTLTAADASALTTGGIRNLSAMYATRATIPANQDTTFNPYTGATIAVATGTKVVQVNEVAVESVIVRQTDPNSFGDVYVAFGVGKTNTMLGKTMSQAPVHFPDNGGINPNNAYGRFGLVFRVAKGTGTTGTPVSSPLPRAEFVGVVEFHEEGIASSDDHIAEYYQSTK